MILISGPCVIESRDLVFQIAEHMKKISDDLKLDYYFKASFDKANRSSVKSFRGPGLEKGLDILSDVKKQFNLKICTDIHNEQQADLVGEVADIIQIPAFLCRQTDLLVAAGNTNKIVNVKKGQFMAPWDMKNVVDKLESTGNHKIMLCERGTTFGYNNLVVDMTSIYEMRKFGYPVIFDATHSVQKPGGNGDSTGGNREYISTLAKAAISAGADGLFLEVHPDPDKALSDGPNSLNLNGAKDLLIEVSRLYECIRNA